MISPTAGASLLVLRVDIDPRSPVSPVMNRISGDLFQLSRLASPGRRPVVRRVYRASWIVDAPHVTWQPCQVEIEGAVRFWDSTHTATRIRVKIGWGDLTAAGPAEVTFTGGDNVVGSFRCPRVSDCFRDVKLETDICASVHEAPWLPTYNTDWHDNRPADLPLRVLTIESAYREAGVRVSMAPAHTVIDDSAAQFRSWSPAELHDAMESYYSQTDGAWPQWQMWGLMAGQFDNSGVGGIMFDAAAQYGGAGEAPERQGFAVFRSHEWFASLVDGTPANQDQAWAMRHFLYTFVHEAGHAYNLLHSWNKSRPDALSWMNYDWKYDQRNGADSFWSSFRFRFDEEELIHIRHGNRTAVIMGGDPWGSGGHLEIPPQAMAAQDGDAPVELRVRSREYFQLMEPVLVELRLRNLLADIPVTIDMRFRPEFGGVTVFIRRPDGRLLEFQPAMCMLATPEPVTLAPARSATPGQDRLSREIFVGFGRQGFCFDQPGDYLIRAVYQGAGDLFVPSNVHRIRIGPPASPEVDRFAQDYFSTAVGLALYLDGSHSPFLASGRRVLESVLDRFAGSQLAAKVAVALAQGLARPFHRVQAETLTRATLVQVGKPDPAAALKMTDSALKTCQGEPIKAGNLAYERLVRRRSDFHRALGQQDMAKQEYATLRRDLAGRGVKAAVLQRLEAQEKGL